MPFATGKYTLRASIVGGFGNKFATGNGIDKVVTTQVPSTIGAQVVSRRGFRLFRMILNH